ncbi:MAG: 50S ribosomal protein L32e [Thermoplasmatota archaeon]
MAEKEKKVEKKAKPAEKKTVRKETGEKKPVDKKAAPPVKKTVKKESQETKKTPKKEDKKPAKSEKDEQEKRKVVKEKKKTAKKKAESESGPVKIKPVLDEKTRELLEKREERAVKQPKFRRNEWFRYKRLGENWKRPRGVSNKTRKNLKYRAPKVRAGFGKPAEVRGYHPSGFQEVLVHNRSEIEGIDPKVQAIRIGSTVGIRKRRGIVEEADKKKIRVLNRGGL